MTKEKIEIQLDCLRNKDNIITNPNLDEVYQAYITRNDEY